MVYSGGVPFPVFYLDGDTESSLGEFTLDDSFNFNNFLSFLSQLIGISPHNFSVYLSSFGTNRRIPITSKVNVAGFTDAFFLVKRSRRPRRSKPRNRGSRNNAANDSNNDYNVTPENVVILRRNDAVPVFGMVENEKRVRELQMEKERFFIKTAPGGSVFCKECMVGNDGRFHLCVNDPMTVGFRSPAGPVVRPVKGKD